MAEGEPGFIGRITRQLAGSVMGTPNYEQRAEEIRVTNIRKQFAEQVRTSPARTDLDIGHEGEGPAERGGGPPGAAPGTSDDAAAALGEMVAAERGEALRERLDEISDDYSDHGDGGDDRGRD